MKAAKYYNLCNFRTTIRYSTQIISEESEEEFSFLLEDKSRQLEALK